MKNLICFDLDGTLTSASTWVSFNTRLGITPEEDDRLFQLFREGTIDYSEWIASLVDIYKRHEPVTKTDILAVAEMVELRPDAEATIKALQEKGYDVILISGGVDIIVGAIAARLGLGHWQATNKALWNEVDELTGIKPIGDERAAKLALLEAYCHKNGHALQEVIAVGDGGNDVEIFKKTKGILLGSNKDLAPLAWKQIERLSEIVEFI